MCRFAVFISASTGFSEAEDDLRNLELRGHLDADGLLTREVRGCYDGKAETSFEVRMPVSTPAAQLVDAVYFYAYIYSQKCVLLVDWDNDRHAFIATNGDTEVDSHNIDWKSGGLHRVIGKPDCDHSFIGGCYYVLSM